MSALAAAVQDHGALPAAVAAVFLLAGIVKGVIGLGLPTIAVGLLTLVMAPVEAAALLVVPSLATNIWQMLAGSHLRPMLRRLWPMMAGIVAGTLAAGGLLASASGAHAAGLVGVVLVLYAALSLSRVRFSVPERHEPWLSPLMGLATGVVTAATATFVLPGTPYMQALRVEKDALVQAMGLSFTVSTAALTPALVTAGALDGRVAAGSAVALASALAGMLLGRRLRDAIGAETFRTCFFATLLLLGTHLAWRALT